MMGRRTRLLALLLAGLAVLLVHAPHSAHASAADWTAVNTFLAGASLFDAATTAPVNPKAAPYGTVLVTVGETVDELVYAGTVTLGNVSCGAAQLSGALALATTAPGPASLRTSVSLSDLSFECSATLSWTGVSVPSLAIAGSAGSVVFRETATGAALAADGVWTLGPGRLLADPDRPVSFATDVSSCSVSADVAGDTLLESGPADPTFSLLLRTIAHEVLARQVVCGALAAALDVELTAALTAFNGELDALAQDSPAGAPELAGAEAAMLSSLTAQQQQDAVQFGDSGVAALALAFARQLLGAPANSTDEPAVNAVVRRLSDTTDGTVHADLSGIPDFGDAALFNGSVSFGSNVTVGGLATFAALDALRPAAALVYSLTSALELDELRVAATVRADAVGAGAASADGRLAAGAALTLRCGALQLLARNVSANVTQAVAFNEAEISGVQLGQLRDTPLPCGSPGVYAVNVSALELLPVAAPVELLVDGCEDAGLQAASAGVTQLLNLLWAPTLSAELVPLVRGLAPLATDAVNQVAADEAVAPCPVLAADATPGALVDFDGSDARALQDAVADTVAIVDDPQVGINRVMRELSDFSGDPAGVFETNDTAALQLTFEADGDSALTLRVTSLRFENTDSFTALTLLRPVGGSPTVRSESRVAFGKGGLPLVVEVELEASGTGALDMLETTQLRFEMSDFALEGEADVNVLQRRLRELTVGEVGSLSCLAATLDVDGPQSGLGVRALAVNSSALALDCSSCGLTAAEEQQRADDLRVQVDLLLQLFVERANVGSARVAVNDGVRDLSADCIGRVPTPAPTRDAEIGLQTVYYTNAGAWALATGAAAAALLGGAAARRRRQRAGKLDDSEGETGRRQLAKAAPRALMMHAWTPVWVRVSVVLLCVVALALFLTSNGAETGRVQAVITFEDGREVRLDDIFTLTLTGTIADLIATDLALLGVVSALMTASWPYVRLAALLGCFMAPPAALGEAARGKLLGALDYLGKWIVVDQLLILVLVVVLDVQLTPGQLDAVAPDGTALRTRVRPGWGLYGFLLGAVASAAASNLVLRQHRSAASPPALATARQLQPTRSRGGGGDADVRKAARVERVREPLRLHVFQPLRASDGARLQMKFGPAAVVWVGASCVLCMAGIVAAVFLDSVTFDYKGAGGAALLVLARGSESVSLSLATFAQKLGAQAVDAAETPGVSLAQVFFFVTVLVVPLVQQALLLVAFFAKLTLREQRALWALQDGLRVWALLEVFAVAMAAALQNVGAFVTFATASLCRDLNRVIKTYVVPFGLLGANEASCFTVFGSVAPGYYVLLLAALLGLFNAYTLNSVARLAIEEREEMAFAAAHGAGAAGGDAVAAVRGAAVHVYEAPRNFGFFHWAVTRHLRRLSRTGFVRVRMAPAAQAAGAAGGKSAKVAVYGGGDDDDDVPAARDVGSQGGGFGGHAFGGGGGMGGGMGGGGRGLGIAPPPGMSPHSTDPRISI